MKIIHISDQHGAYRSINLVPGDVVIHTGDALATGAFDEYAAFLDWLAAYPCPVKLSVPGNHDWSAQAHQGELEDEAARRGITVLIDRAIEVQGVKFYGSPWVPYRDAWGWPEASRGFVLPLGSEALAQRWAAVPDDVEVLLTHGPAQGRGDGLAPDSYWHSVGEGEPGCALLRGRLAVLGRLRLHLFGHIHDRPGVFSVGPTRFVNSAQTLTVLEEA